MSETIGIYGPTIITMDSSRRIYEDGYVVIKEDKVVEIGSGRTKKRSNSDIEINASGKVVIPGLVNAHVHTRPVRAVGDGFTTYDWHNLYVDPISSVLTEEDSYAGGLLAFAELIKSGTTCALAMTNIPQGCARAAQDIGIRAVVCPHAADHPEHMSSCDRFEDNLELVKNQSDKSDERVRYWFGFEGLLGTSFNLIKKIREVASKFKVGIHTHVGETEGEVEIIKEKYGKREVEYLHDLGLLNSDVVLTHCVWIDRNEIEILARNNVNVVHCPISNMKLASGIAPILEMKDRGVNVALGTDGMLSSFKLDMFEVMRVACMLQRVNKLDAKALNAEDALQMATIGGAKALGLDKYISSIEEGKKADLAIVDFKKVNLNPIAPGKHKNIIPLLVFSAYGSDVDTVIIDGKIILREGKLININEEEIIHRASKSANRILNQIEI